MLVLTVVLIADIWSEVIWLWFLRLFLLFLFGPLTLIIKYSRGIARKMWFRLREFKNFFRCGRIPDNRSIPSNFSAIRSSQSKRNRANNAAVIDTPPITNVRQFVTRLVSILANFLSKFSFALRAGSSAKYCCQSNMLTMDTNAMIKPAMSGFSWADSLTVSRIWSMISNICVCADPINGKVSFASPASISLLNWLMLEKYLVTSCAMPSGLNLFIFDCFYLNLAIDIFLYIFLTISIDLCYTTRTWELDVSV